MEKCIIADLVNLKCEERDHYYNCLMCQRCWLLCASYGEYKTKTACEDLKHGYSQDFIYSTQRAVTSAKNILLQDIILSSSVNLHFPTLRIESFDCKSTIHKHPSAMNGTVANFNKIFCFRRMWDELYSRNVVV